MDTNTNGTALALNGGTHLPSKVLETVTAGGDLKKLSPEERGQYILALCESVGLNPLSRPIQLIELNGKLVPYAVKDCTDQLRRIHNVSVQIVSHEIADGLIAVTARATLPSGREDQDVGVVSSANLKGEALANAMMKAHTKAKRRVTLSIVGLGILDESELDTVPQARRYEERAFDVNPEVIEDKAHEKVAEYLTAIANAPTVADLQRIGEALAKEPGPVKEAVRGDYSTRTKALKSAEKTREPGAES